MLRNICLLMLQWSMLVLGTECISQKLVSEEKQIIEKIDNRSLATGLLIEKELTELREGYKYDILLFFKNPSRTPIKTKIEYKSFLNLSSGSQHLRVQKKVNGNLSSQTTEIKKSSLRMFILNDRYLFKPGRDMHKYSIGAPTWGLVIINGPMMVLLYHELNDPVINEVLPLYKEDQKIAYTLSSLGGFLFRKSVPEYFSDHPYISSRIAEKNQGYQKKDVYKIILEYNNWYKNEYPERFRYFLYH